MPRLATIWILGLKICFDNPLSAKKKLILSTAVLIVCSKTSYVD